MLWGVERAIAGFSHIGADTNVQHKLHVVLPGSPNRGVFGGDGAYGEVKSAFDAIVNRARAEKVWSSRVTFAHPKIGWVRGTGLMVGNDPLVAVVERHGIRTYSTAQIAAKLLDLCTAESREQALKAPLDVDLTGGLGSEPIDIKALRAEAMADAEKEAAAASSQETDGSVAGRSTGLSDSSRGQQIKALPTPIVTKQASVDLNDWTNVTAKPEDEIVIVSVGELGPWGSGRTRAQAELGHRIGTQGDHRRSHRAACGLRQRLGQTGVHREARLAIQRHLETWEQRRGIDVVLHERVGHHQVAHAHAFRQSARRAGEDDAVDTETLDQRRRRGGRGHLADARQHRHHLVPVPVADPEVAAGHALALLVGQARQHGRQLLLHRRDNAGATVGFHVKSTFGACLASADSYFINSKRRWCRALS